MIRNHLPSCMLHHFKGKAFTLDGTHPVVKTIPLRISVDNAPREQQKSYSLLRLRSL